MNWITFIVASYIALVLEVSVRTALTLHSVGKISPSFVAPLVVFLALAAPRFHAIAACLILGLLMDLSTPLSQQDGTELIVPGPHALGFALCAWLIVHIRISVFRDRVLTVAAMTLAMMLVTAVVVLLLYRVRAMFPDGGQYFPSGSMWSEMFRWIGDAIYTALLAVPLGWMLLRSVPVWGFVQHLPRVGSAVR